MATVSLTRGNRLVAETSVAVNGTAETPFWSGAPTSTLVPPWSGNQSKAADRITIMSAPPASARHGDRRKWMRFEVRAGDLIGTGTTSERAQLIANTKTAAFGKEGVSCFNAMSVIFDRTYNPPKGDAFPEWNIWHQYFSEPGQAPFNYQVDANRRMVVCVQSTGTDPNRPIQYGYDIAPLLLDTPIDIIEHYVWSDNPSLGRYALWARVGDGDFAFVPAVRRGAAPALTKDGSGRYIVQTLYSPKDIATVPMQGWYRHLHTETDVMYQTGVQMFATYAGALASFG